MRVYTAPYVMHVPKDPDELVEKLFGNARSVLRTVRNHRPTVVTLFKSASDYVAHYHVLVPDVKDKGVPNIRLLIDREQCDAFVAISLSEIHVSGNKEGHPEGQSLFLVFHSNSASRVVYQTFTVAPNKDQKGLPIIKMGKLFKTDKSINLLGFGDLESYRLARPPYLG